MPLILFESIDKEIHIYFVIIIIITRVLTAFDTFINQNSESQRAFIQSVRDVTYSNKAIRVATVGVAIYSKPTMPHGVQRLRLT